MKKNNTTVKNTPKKEPKKATVSTKKTNGRKIVTERQMIDLIAQKLSAKTSKKEVGKNEVKEVITTFKNLIIELIPTCDFKLINFLKIFVKRRMSKKIRQPGNNTLITVPEKNVARFSAGKLLSEAASKAKLELAAKK